MTESPVEDLKWATLIILGIVLTPIFLFVLYVALLLFEPSHLHPRYEEFNKRGYYTYVVPPSIVEQYGWREETYIWSWSRHCNLDNHTRNNPIKVSYLDSENEPVFHLEITRWGLFDWAALHPNVDIPFDIPWAKAGTLEMFEQQHWTKGTPVIYLRFRDWHDTSVYVVSQLPLTDTLTILYTLNYVGAPPERAEPWERCENW